MSGTAFIEYKFIMPRYEARLIGKQSRVVDGFGKKAVPFISLHVNSSSSIVEFRGIDERLYAGSAKFKGSEVALPHPSDLRNCYFQLGE